MQSSGSSTNHSREDPFGGTELFYRGTDHQASKDTEDDLQEEKKKSPVVAWQLSDKNFRKAFRAGGLQRVI